MQPPTPLEVIRERAETAPDDVIFQLVGEGDSRVELTNVGLRNRVARLGDAVAAAGFGDGGRVAICVENRPAWPVVYMSTWYAGSVAVPIDPALEPPAIRRVLEHSGARLVVTSRALSHKVASACHGVENPPLIVDLDAEATTAREAPTREEGGGTRAWDGESPGAPVPLASPATPQPGAALTAVDDFVDKHADQSAGWHPRIDHDSFDDLGTLVYTSGTTGTPKGVMLSRGGLYENIRSGLETIDLRASDHVLGVLPLFHVLPLLSNCLGPIHRGCRVTFLADLNPDKIIAAFRRHEITAFACVPLFFYRFHDRVMQRLAELPAPRRTVARTLLKVSGFARRRLGLSIGKRLFAAAHEPFGDKMRLLVTGGARFDPQVYSDFLDLGFPLVQGYGLTEATALLTVHPRSQVSPTTVGSPIEGVRLRFDDVDSDGIGEIVAHSRSLMLGYYRDETATAAALQDGWLKTGDLGRLLPNGQLQITGRAKDVIVLASGKNIYPEELEAVYGRSDWIEELCILGIPDPTRRGAERLHAMVVPNLEFARRRGQANVREMVKWEIDSVASGLTGPQRISSLELRTEPLPRTTTRKVKRFELREEVMARLSGSHAANAPIAPDAVAAENSAGGRSASVDSGADDRPRAADDLRAFSPPAPAEDTSGEPGWAHDVRALIAKQARVEGVRRDQHFDIDLGMESLDRIELHAELEAALGFEIPAERAGQLQTVGEMLDLVAGQVAAPTTGSTNGPGETDRWAELLRCSPEEIEPYLKPRPVAKRVFRALLVILRGVFSTYPGFAVSGAENLPTEYPFIIAANHCSYVDPFLLMMALPRRLYRRVFLVGYSAYFSGGLTSLAGRLMRTIPIDQNANLERALQAAAEGLRREMVLVIFPEGGRSSDGSLQRFRRGTGILARNLDVPVVPAGIWGAYEMWPRGGSPRLHRVGIAIGAAERIAPQDTSSTLGPREREAELVNRLSERVKTLTAQARTLV